MFLKIAAQAVEAGDFFLRFWIFEAHFLVQTFLIKKTCIISPTSLATGETL